MGTEVKTEQEQEQEDFGAAFATLASSLKEPGSETIETPEAKAAREAAATAAAAATETPEAKAAREAAATAAAAATETPEAKAAREAAATAAAAATETPEAKAAREAAATAAAAAAKTPEQTAAEKATADLAEANRKLAEATAALEEAKKPAVVAAAAAAAPIEDKPPALYNAEEQAVLDKYTAEWDVVRKGEELIRRGEYRAIVQHIFQEIEKNYGPIREYIEARSPRDQLSDIKALAPDYDAVRDKAIAWVETQPSIMKNAYHQVIKDGTPAQVAELIDTYKKSTNYQAPAAAAAAAPAAGAPPVTPQQTAAILALKPVGTARTEQGSGGPDVNDFDGAFATFAAVK